MGPEYYIGLATHAFPVASLLAPKVVDDTVPTTLATYAFPVASLLARSGTWRNGLRRRSASQVTYAFPVASLLALALSGEQGGAKSSDTRLPSGFITGTPRSIRWYRSLRPSDICLSSGFITGTAELLKMVLIRPMSVRALAVTHAFPVASLLEQGEELTGPVTLSLAATYAFPVALLLVPPSCWGRRDETYGVTYAFPVASLLARKVV
jgi:hypothetical protein